MDTLYSPLTTLLASLFKKTLVRELSIEFILQEYWRNCPLAIIEESKHVAKASVVH